MKLSGLNMGQFVAQIWDTQQQVIRVVCVMIHVEAHARWLGFTTCGNKQRGVIGQNVTTRWRLFKDEKTFSWGCNKKHNEAEI